MNKVQKASTKDNSFSPRISAVERLTEQPLDSRIVLIQELIPLGLIYVSEFLQEEVTRLAGPRYKRSAVPRDVVRWGNQPGSVYLQDVKCKVRVPRVRDRRSNQEIPLSSYQALQKPTHGDEGLLKKVLLGLSCNKYKETALTVPEVFGLSPSSVSKRFITSSTRHFRAFNQRRLEQYDIIAVIVDGKTFAEDEMVIAIGITMNGEKVFLGFIQAGTENASVCGDFFRSLIERGLLYEQGILFVIDGAKGMLKAIKDVFGDYAEIQRCQWHKRENIVSYLPKSQQASMRDELQQAYEKDTYGEAHKALMKCRRTLEKINMSAVTSFDEGFEETLTLHSLGVFPQLGISLKTTNCIESINAQLSRMLDRVTRWNNSNQKHRWLASALLLIEPNLRKIKGYKALHFLRHALQEKPKNKNLNVA